MNKRDQARLRRLLADNLSYVDGGIAELALMQESIEATLAYALRSVAASSVAQHVNGSVDPNNDADREVLRVMVTEMLQRRVEVGGRAITVGVI